MYQSMLLIGFNGRISNNLSMMRFVNLFEPLIVKKILGRFLGRTKQTTDNFFYF